MELFEEASLNGLQLFVAVLVAFDAEEEFVEFCVFAAFKQFIVESAVRVCDECVELAPVSVEFFSKF